MRGFLFSTTFFLLCFSACGKNECPCQKESVNLHVSTIPTDLDSFRTFSLGETTLAKLLMEGLVRLSNSGKIELAAAKEYSVSNEGKTYTFILKETSWSDGTSVTAHDFVNAWRKALSSSNQSPHQSLFFAIKNGKEVRDRTVPSTLLGVKALNKQVLSIELSEPNPYFLQNLAHPVFFPQHKSSPSLSKKAFLEKHVINNGPFLLENWEENGLNLKHNKNHWDKDQAALKSVSLRSSNDDLASSSKIVETPLTFLLNELNPHMSIAETRNKETCFVRLNKNHPSLKDIEKRAALFSLFHTQPSISQAIGKHGKKASKLIPNLVLDYELELSENISNEQHQNHTLVYHQEALMPLVEILSTQENLDCKYIEKKEYDALVESGEYEIALESVHQISSDPLCYLELFCDGEDSEYSALLNRARQCENKNEREELYISAEKLLLSKKVFIPIYHGNIEETVHPETDDIAINTDHDEAP